jgi:hypothetical protein
MAKSGSTVIEPHNLKGERVSYVSYASRQPRDSMNLRQKIPENPELPKFSAKAFWRMVFGNCEMINTPKTGINHNSWNRRTSV